MIHHDKCPLCSGNKISYYLTGTDYLTSKEQFEIFKCADCTFTFTQNYPEEDKINLYYDSEEYISHSDTNKGIINNFYKLARSIMLQKKKRIIIKASGLRTGNLLDIGSGTGHFANEMNNSGWNVTGVEINNKVRENAISSFGLNFILPEKMSSLPDNSFDCITLWHVMEHFHEPNKYFREINRLVRPAGVVIVALPNIDSPDAVYYGKYWAALDVPRHLWHFNLETFKKIVEYNGFRYSESFNLPLDVFYISILSEKYKGSRIPFLKGMIMGMIFFIRAFSNKARGSSVIYIIRKSTD
jgi:2-polyprenyl-3-methyl-5-hydroxy-6-metoxy-1,4-benzoquinol methylase